MPPKKNKLFSSLAPKNAATARPAASPRQNESNEHYVAITMGSEFKDLVQQIATDLWMSESKTIVKGMEPLEVDWDKYFGSGHNHSHVNSAHTTTSNSQTAATTDSRNHHDSHLPSGSSSSFSAAPRQEVRKILPQHMEEHLTACLAKYVAYSLKILADYDLGGVPLRNGIEIPTIFHAVDATTNPQIHQVEFTWRDPYIQRQDERNRELYTQLVSLGKLELNYER